MKAAVLKELNGPPVFDDFEDPVAGEGQAVVEIAAAAIHHVDLARASGTFYLGPPPLPSVLGVETHKRPMQTQAMPRLARNQRGARMRRASRACAPR